MGYGKKIIIGALIAIFSFVNAVAKNETSQVSRYMTVTNKPLSSQRDLLSQTIQIRFQQSVQNIGDAINHLLRYSGYSLVMENQRGGALKNTLQKPLPLVDRELGPMSLKDALIILAGPAFTLVEDPLNREVDFHLKTSFSQKLHHGA